MATTYAIPDGRVAMAATLYNGTGAAQNINNTVNGVSFQPDLVWVKGRSFASYNGLIDSVRGRAYDLYSNATSAEETSGSTEDLTAFTSSGFSLGTPARFGSNTSGQTYVGWQWKGGGTSVSNTAGSITSSVSANPTAGFSVVTWTGNGSTSGVTIGHGLGVAPSMVILKARSSATDWVVYHASVGNTKGLFLNLTNAATTNAAYWNNTTPTSTVFTTTGDTGASNQSGVTYVTYCFAPVAGYSAFGSYVGTNTSNGPFVYLGFRPRFIMVKSSSTGGSATYGWAVFDTSRENYNINRSMLVANVSDAENTTIDADLDILSNGFKVRYSPNYTNGPNTYIYMAFAENPFKYANAR